MMAGHTPGPWIIFSDRDDELKVRSSQDDFVADCADGFWSDEADGWIMAEESWGNAQLIAAAPDLLAALNAVFEDYTRKGSIGKAAYGQMQVALRRAQN